MPSNIKTLRSSVAGRRPTGKTAADFGELYYNDADKVLGIIDAAGTAYDFTGVKVTIKATAPASPDEGDIWYDSGTSMRTYVWDSAAWVDVSPVQTAGVILSDPPAGLSQTITAGAVADVPLTLKGMAGQTANLQEWQNSAGRVIAVISSNGSLEVHDATGAQRHYLGSGVGNAGISNTLFIGDVAGSGSVGKVGDWGLELNGVAGTITTGRGSTTDRVMLGSLGGGSASFRRAGYGDVQFHLAGNAIELDSFAGGANYFRIRAENAGAAAGNVENKNNAYGAWSDIRFKENVTDANPQLDDIKAMRIVNFNFKVDDPNQKQIGMIAQELEKVKPGLVDTDAEDGMKSIKYSVLVPILVKAVQELTARLETLEGAKT